MNRPATRVSRRTVLTAAPGAPAAATGTGCLGQEFDLAVRFEPAAPSREEQS